MGCTPQDGIGSGEPHERVVTVPVLAKDDMLVGLAHNLEHVAVLRVPRRDRVRFEHRVLRCDQLAGEACVIVDGHAIFLVREDDNAAGVVRCLLDHFELFEVEALRQVDVGKLAP